MPDAAPEHEATKAPQTSEGSTQGESASADIVDWIPLRPLTADAFRPYGAVLEATGVATEINQGTTLKFADLACVELDRNARAALHIYRPTPATLPAQVQQMERHPLASQAFIPLGAGRFVVLVAEGNVLGRDQIVGFLTNARQGVQLAAGVWHHPLLALDAVDFLVVDRHCPRPEDADRNLEVVDVSAWRCGVDAG